MSSKVTIATDMKAVDAMRARWEALAAETSDANLFCSFAWNRAWLESFAQTYDRILIVEMELPGVFHGILPLIEQRTRAGGMPVRSLELVGGDDAVYKAPLVLGDRDAFLDAVLTLLLEEIGAWQTVVLDSFTDDSEWLPAFTRSCERRSLRYELHEQRPAPYLVLPAEYEVFRSSLKKNLRQNLARRTNLARRKGAVIERLSGAEVRPEHLREAQDVERRSWKHRNGVGMLVDDQHLALHLGLLGRAAFAPDMAFLRVDGLVVAFQYGFIQGNRYYAYNNSFDEAHDDLSPGLLLINQLLTELIPAGISVYDFLVGNDRYKRDWASHSRNTVGLTIYRPSIGGRVAFGVDGVRRQLRGLRDVVHRRTGRVTA